MATQLEEDNSLFRTVPLEQYLHDVIDAIDPSYCMIVTEQHRRKMIRCLLGFKNKAEFNLKLQNINAELQWKKTSQFFKDDLAVLHPPPCETKAPRFREGVRMQQEGDPRFLYQQLENQNQTQYMVPSRLFSFLARGKTYQGSFERLLLDVAPNLLERYQDIVQERSEIDLMRMLVLEESKRGDVETANPAVTWKDQLQQLLEKEFDSKGSQQPEDSGQIIGKKGELNLTSYLEERSQNASDSSTMVISNVLVKPPNRHLRQINQCNSPRKRLPHVILSNANLVGMTSEFDSMVVEKVDNKLRIVELWEAKASLTPVTISDALFKKMSALNAILKDPDASISFSPQSNQQVREFLTAGNSKYSGALEEDEPIIFPLASHYHDSNSANGKINEDDNAYSTRSPTIGIFGMHLMSPKAAARRTQFVHCEALLVKSEDAVLQALETGYVFAPDIRPNLESMLREAQRLEPMLIVPASSD